MSCTCCLLSYPTWSQVKEGIVAHKKKLLLAHFILSMGSVYAAASYLSPPASTAVIVIGGINWVANMAISSVVCVNSCLRTPPASQQLSLNLLPRNDNL